LSVLVGLALAIALSSQGSQVAVTVASPGAVTVREPAFDLPHIYADTDLELARETGREIAKDRLDQLIIMARVGRGTLYQAPLASLTRRPSTTTWRCGGQAIRPLS
jgi:acyl-homoserine lactone acylase PvdQ